MPNLGYSAGLKPGENDSIFAKVLIKFDREGKDLSVLTSRGVPMSYD